MANENKSTQSVESTREAARAMAEQSIATFCHWHETWGTGVADRGKAESRAAQKLNASGFRGVMGGAYLTRDDVRRLLATK